MIAVRPPVPPMLAKLAYELPRGDGWVYEPKWDGFRAIVFREDDELHIASRRNRPLGRYFPEVERLLGEHLPATVVVDGEIILPSPDGLDFDALQLRLHPAASRVTKLAEQTPASFVVFDLLASGDEDLMGLALAERLRRLDELFGEHRPEDPAAPATLGGPRLYLTSRTNDADQAARWFDDLERVKLDGIIAKRLEGAYHPGERGWVKVKHRRTADCVVAGYRLHKDGKGIGSLLLGLYDDDRLHYVGHTSSFKAAERRELLELLRPLERPSSFEGEHGPGGPSRWRPEQEAEFVALRPVLVCGVAYDYLQGDWRFRHAATFLRWRDDKQPTECTFDQVRN
jgi:ATP-dependent DNA ligase